MPEPLRRDPYKVLQVDPEADPEVVQAAYRRLAQKHHPDLSSQPDSAERMAEINAAWEIVGDPARRAEHDRERALRLAQGARPEPSTSSAPTVRPDAAASSSAVDPSDRWRPHVSEVSSDWSSGRSSVGSGYDDSMRRNDSEGAAGPPPGNPAGSVLNFGRYAGWSLGEIARYDVDYLEWLDRMPIGRSYRDEIDGLLRRVGRRRSVSQPSERRGLFRRR